MNKIKTIISIIIAILYFTILQELMLAVLVVPADKIERIQDYPKLEEQIKKNFVIVDPIMIHRIINNITNNKIK